MIRKASDKEWEMAERINSVIQDKIHKHFMESVNSNVFCRAKALVPIIENLNMEITIGVPKEMRDEDNSTLALTSNTIKTAIENSF